VSDAHPDPLDYPRLPALPARSVADSAVQGWVQQNYIRAATLTQANARLVDAQTHIPLAQAWGGGEVASADGLRFVVPIRTLNAGPSSPLEQDGERSLES
jgi:TnpA family transposase